MVANADDDSKLWHFRICHKNYGSLRHMSCLHLGVFQRENLPVVFVRDV